MKSAIFLNNEATRLIEKRNYKVALSMLGEGLESLQNQLDDQGDCVMEYDHNHTYSKDEDVYSSLDERVMQLRRKASFKESLVADEDFVYRHPINAKLSLSNEGEKGIYILSVILVFNMALVHHLVAIEKRCQNCPKRFKAALTLYNLAFHLQMKGNVSIDMTYVIAMVNNCAHIYKTFNKQKRSQKFYNHMLSSLLMMVETGEANTIDELDGFLWNASRLILRPDVAAAAA